MEWHLFRFHFPIKISLFLHVFSKPLLGSVFGAPQCRCCLHWSVLVPLYGPTVGALNAESPKRIFFKKIKKAIWSRNKCFPYGFPPYLHARNCDHFQWFPHTPTPPRPLKRPQTKMYFWTLFQKKNTIFESPWGYRSLVPPWGHKDTRRRKNNKFTTKTNIIRLACWISRMVQLSNLLHQFL